MKLLVAIFVLHATAFAATPVVIFDATTNTVAVAGEGEISVHEGSRGDLRYARPLDLEPTFGIAAKGQILLLDAITNRGVILDIESRRSRSFRTGETPVDAAAFDGGFLVLCRDQSSISHHTLDGDGRIIAVPEQSTMLEVGANRAFVYSSSSGELASFGEKLNEVSRTKTNNGASDLEISGTYLYLVYPRKGRVEAFDTKTLELREHFTVGAVPVDLVSTSEPNLIGAGTLAVADPSSKRVWREEGSQSEMQAFSRGFLRGMLGLGLYGGKSTEIPTGVDRLFKSGKRLWAYDTSSRTLYAVSTKRITKAAENIDHRSIAPDERGGVWIMSAGGELQHVGGRADQ